MEDSKTKINRAITIAEMREWENATWAAGIEEEPVMRKAGKAVADCVLSLTKEGDEVLVVAGKGKNGGDALYAAEYLPERKVHILNVTTADHEKEATRIISEFKGAALIDGLFGIGLNRPLTGGFYESVVNAINGNDHIKFKVAVDNPSGLDCDSGEALGGLAVKCTHTVTFGAMKLGLMKNPTFTGEVRVAQEIGLIPFPFH